MLQVIVAIVLVALAYQFAAPRLAPAGAEQRAKGLGVLQALCTLVGIVVLAYWYLVDRPDRDRLKFDQAVTAAPLGDGRALIVADVTIANVGSHAAEFTNAAYAFFVQQVAPIDPKGDVAKDLAKKGPYGLPRVRAGYNWDPLAYAIAVAPYGPYKVTESKGFSAEIEPGESDSLYLRAAVPCTPGLHVSVSTRFYKQLPLMQRLARTRLVYAFHPSFSLEIGRPKPFMWIKQSFLDLTDTCKPKP